MAGRPALQRLGAGRRATGSCWSTPGCTSRARWRTSSGRSSRSACGSSTCGWSSAPTRTPTTAARPARSQSAPAASCGCTPTTRTSPSGAQDLEAMLARRIEVARQSGVPEEPLRRWAEERRDQGLGHAGRCRAAARPRRRASTVETDLGDWNVIETPGHAPSHVCLHQPERRLLISGDHLLGRVSLYFDYGWTPDPVGEFLTSLDNVDALDARLGPEPATGARSPTSHGHVEANRRLVAERLDAVRAALAEGPRHALRARPARVRRRIRTPERRTWLHDEDAAPGCATWKRSGRPRRRASPRRPGGGGRRPRLARDAHRRAIAGRRRAPASPSSSSRPRRTRASATSAARSRSCSRLDPTFVSVTYGAGGIDRAEAPRRSTSSAASRPTTASRRWRTSPASARRSTSCARRSTACATPGIENVLALRGDPPRRRRTEWTATEGGLSYSRELIELIRADYDFAIGAACFPETHIHAESAPSPTCATARRRSTPARAS